MGPKINIDKLICSILNSHQLPVSFHFDIIQDLKEQGLEFKDGKIQYEATMALEKLASEQTGIDPEIGQAVEKHLDELIFDTPKFKVGNWINREYDNMVFEVLDVSNDVYTLKNTSGKIIKHSRIELEGHSFYTYKLWNIKDAKYGDVLTVTLGNNSKYVCIFRGVKDNKIDTYVFYNTYTGVRKGIVATVCDQIKVFPATKEECSLLFTMMHKAGYRWNADKKQILSLDASTENVKCSVYDVPENCELYPDCKDCSGNTEKLTGFEVQLRDCILNWNNAKDSNEITLEGFVKDWSNILTRQARKQIASEINVHKMTKALSDSKSGISANKLDGYARGIIATIDKIKEGTQS